MSLAHSTPGHAGDISPTITVPRPINTQIGSEELLRSSKVVSSGCHSPFKIAEPLKQHILARFVFGLVSRKRGTEAAGLSRTVSSRFTLKISILHLHLHVVHRTKFALVWRATSKQEDSLTIYARYKDTRHQHFARSTAATTAVL